MSVTSLENGASWVKICKTSRSSKYKITSIRNHLDAGHQNMGRFSGIMAYVVISMLVTVHSLSQLFFDVSQCLLVCSDELEG